MYMLYGAPYVHSMYMCDKKETHYSHTYHTPTRPRSKDDTTTMSGVLLGDEVSGDFTKWQKRGCKNRFIIFKIHLKKVSQSVKRVHCTYVYSSTCMYFFFTTIRAP